MLSTNLHCLCRQALTQLLRMPESEADVWQAWGTSVFHDDTGYSEHKGQGLEAYILDQLEQTRDEPGADFFSWLNTVEHEGCKLTEDEKLGIALLVFAGGVTPSSRWLAFALSILLIIRSH